jgi:HEPN domain-containing protein
MEKLTLEWIEKAEGDYASAERELRARKAPNYDSACFHAQQCIEKYLKAYLQEVEIAFGKTHDLSVLLDLVLPLNPSWELHRIDLRALTTFAVEYRYPGESADKEIARSAVVRCRRLRQIIRRSLNF